MGAWIGWLGNDTTGIPLVLGQAYLGRQGIQRAEYQAAIYGVSAALACFTTARRPTELVLHVDNETVFNTLSGAWKTDVLTPLKAAANALGAQLRALGVRPTVVQVSRDHPLLERANQLTQKAWTQLLFDSSWRPPSRPRSGPTRSSQTGG